MNQSELLRLLDLSTYIAFDFETTGLSPENDRIIEIAAIKFEGGVAVDRFVTLVNPERPIDSFITEITHISNAMVSDAPVEANIIDNLLDFLEDIPLVAHNISFDISFVKILCERYNKEYVERPLYDTLQLARTFLFFHPTHNLGSVSEFFNLSAVGAHRAEADTENTGMIFQHLLYEAASYPLEVFSKILAISKTKDIFNKHLYINISNVLKKEGNLKSGLVDSKLEKPLFNNVFVSDGKSHLADINVEEVFSAGGLLSKVFENYEERKSQQDYSAFVSEMINEDASYCAIEAGTGLGKSLAYLFPALKKAFHKDNEHPVVISCYTKHLQDQLFNKDLPLLAKALNVPLHALILKGRSNYICLTRLNWLISDAQSLLRKGEVESLFPVIVWLNVTQTGDLSECAGFWGHRPYRVAELIQSEPGYCTTQLCAANNGCYFGPIRQAVQESQVIIVNHALLMANISNPGLLPEFESVIIDEAHNLVDIAYNQLMTEVNLFKINAIIDIIDPTTSSAKRWTQKLAPLIEDSSEMKSYFKSLESNCDLSRENAQIFFNELTEIVSKGIKVDIPYPQYIILRNLTEGYGGVFQQIQELELALSELQNAVKGVLNQLEKVGSNRDDLGDLIQLFEHSMDAIASLQTELAMLTHDQQNGWVYWQKGQYRQTRSGEKELFVSINGAPVDIADDLAKLFFQSVKQCILTSATLRVEESFDYFLQRTGLSLMDSETVHTREFHSPFYYDEQVRYYQYSGKYGQNPALVADLLYECHKFYNKRMMALFTSRQALNQVYRELQNKPDGRKLPIFAQVSGSSRYAMLRGMHRTKNGILLGTTSFWEGVDLPRDLLEILIISKLPFSVPTEPITQAYSRMLDEQGRNAFMEFSVPEAVVRFRQGFGRLIRTIEDEGLFIVMDERVVQKRYGSAFSDAIPVRMQTFTRVEELIK
ncbi:MAG: hypothetical protein IIB45_07930 [Candidatus Marinimicrobia bacterium]|nr:hypothetical protein [Candidatus Neomarinimicrobiota bacterium]